MSKPSILTKLRAGKALGAFPGFVDTFNYIVDFIQNLRGDGDDDKAKDVTVDRSIDDHPVIRFKGSKIKIVGTDSSSATVGDPSATHCNTLTFASASDANVTVTVSSDSDGNAVATIGVYYV